MNQEMKKLMSLAESGESKAQLELATRFATGEGVKKSFKSALYWYKQAALDDCPEAHYNLGLMYFLGEGVKRNLDISLDCFLRAADYGSSDACLVIAEAYEVGGFGLKVDYGESVRFYLKAAHLGSPKGIRAIGGLLASENISANELSVIMRDFKLA